MENSLVAVESGTNELASQETLLAETLPLTSLQHFVQNRTKSVYVGYGKFEEVVLIMHGELTPEAIKKAGCHADKVVCDKTAKAIKNAVHHFGVSKSTVEQGSPVFWEIDEADCAIPADPKELGGIVRKKK